MRNFYTQVSDILGTIADIVQPRTFEELERYGFNPSTADIILEDAQWRAARHKGTTQDLHAHFNEIRNSLSRQRLKPHRFIYRGPRSLNINIEADALREILRNLMDNAVKYCIAHDEIVRLVREKKYVEFSLSNVGPALSLLAHRAEAGATWVEAYYPRSKRQKRKSSAATKMVPKIRLLFRANHEGRKMSKLSDRSSV